MTLIEHIEIYLAQLKSDIIHGKGHGKGNLPGLVLFDLQRKEKVLKEALAVLKRGNEEKVRTDNE
jgi:hypothetical protein